MLDSEQMPTRELRIAFKEWASVVLALERGQQRIILRRGGISEDEDVFEPKYARFALFPTYFHQQKSALRPEFVNLVQEAFEREARAGYVRISSWAEVLHVERLESEADLAGLLQLHVYEPHIVLDRLHGTYGRALYALHVCVHCFPRPFELALLPEYGGCKSWVQIESAINAPAFCPA